MDAVRIIATAQAPVYVALLTYHLLHHIDSKAEQILRSYVHNTIYFDSLPEQERR